MPPASYSCVSPLTPSPSVSWKVTDLPCGLLDFCHICVESSFLCKHCWAHLSGHVTTQVHSGLVGRAWAAPQTQVGQSPQARPGTWALLASRALHKIEPFLKYLNILQKDIDPWVRIESRWFPVISSPYHHKTKAWTLFSKLLHFSL